MLKRLISFLPSETQDDLKRRRFRRQILNGRFVCDEPEISLISKVTKAGDWVIDVGANVGHYACHMASCVGETGRVLAFEPVPETFALLAANMRTLGTNNVTLLNVAASDEAGIVSMSMPHFSSGLANFYRAAISDSGEFHVMRVPIDYLQLQPKISVIKIDAEEHDLEVLRGAERLITRDSPILIVEGSTEGPLGDWLRDHGYLLGRAKGSPNIVASKTRDVIDHLASC